MENLKVGEKVMFEVLEDGHPRFNGDSEERTNHGFKRCSPPRYEIGKVRETSVDGKLFQVEYLVNGAVAVWNWYQPTVKARTSFGAEGYLRRADKDAPYTVVSKKNNDGRATCYACGSPTKPCGGWFASIDYRICTKCGK